MSSWPPPQRLATLLGLVLLALYVWRGDGLFFAGFVIFGLVGLAPTAMESIQLSRKVVELRFREQSVQAAGSLDQLAHRVSVTTDELTVAPEHARILKELADALRLRPPSGPRAFAEIVASTVTSAGTILRGQAGYLPSLVMTFKHPLPPGPTTIMVQLETPGVVFVGTPILVSNVGGTVAATEAFRALRIGLTGPSTVAPWINITGVNIAIDSSPRPGTPIQATFMLNDGPSRPFAPIGTVGPIPPVND